MEERLVVVPEVYIASTTAYVYVALREHITDRADIDGEVWEGIGHGNPSLCPRLPVSAGIIMYFLAYNLVADSRTACCIMKNWWVVNLVHHAG